MYLIDEEYLTTVVNVAKNKDVEDLARVFNIVSRDVEDLLSIPLNDLFLSHIESGTTLTDKQSYVLDKVKMYFAFQVHYELLIDDLSFITNQGNTVNDNAPSLDVFHLRRKDSKSKAEHIKSNILKYLADNKADFPEYYSNTTETEEIAKNNFNGSPIVFTQERKIWIGG